MSGEQSTPATGVTAPTYTELSVKDWSGRWVDGKTGFHKDHVNSMLEKHGDKLLDGRSGMKVLLPLCGKTLDMKWFADQGHTVIGVEGVEQAILEFFKEQNLDYTKEPLADIDGDLYKSGENIRMYRCNFFHFTRSLESDFDVVWDRGAFVAINREDRERYVSQIKSLVSSHCRMLISVFQYDETKWPGPPHNTPDDVIPKFYDDEFEVTLLDRQSALEDRWRERGLASFNEVIFFLTHK